MENYNRQQKRQMARAKWHVPDWQKMKYVRTEADHDGKGTFDIYANHLYTCIVRKREGGLTWLSIKRNDLLQIHSWQHLQQIKNDICGDECEGIEIYPPMSRIVDAANQYHLWVFPEGESLGIGFNERMVKQ